MQMNNPETARADLEDFQRRLEVTARGLYLLYGDRRKNGVLPLEKFWPSPIAMPKAQSGSIKITHRIVTDEIAIVGQRQALLTGNRTTKLKLDKQLTIHQLEDDDNGVWMTDLPEELHQIAVMMERVKPKGNVLVGGLGLGLVAHFLRRQKLVREITIVERDENVINLVTPHLPDNVLVIKADVNDFLKTCSSYSCFLLDTWQGTGEATWWAEVMPLKRIIRNRFGIKPVIDCWAEDIMAGQLLKSLAGKHRHWYYEKLPPAMDALEAAHFINAVGMSTWEEKFGSFYPKE